MESCFSYRLSLFKDTYRLSQSSIDDMNNGMLMYILLLHYCVLFSLSLSLSLSLSDFNSLLYDFLSLGINESLDADDIGEFCQQLMTSLV